MKRLVLFLFACQPYRTLYQGEDGYVTGAAGAGKAIFFGLSTGELAAVASNEQGKVFSAPVGTGNAAAGAYSMRSTQRRIFWREPDGHGQMVDAKKLPSTPQPLGAVTAFATYATGALWMASGGGLYLLEDSAEQPTLVGALASLAPLTEFPVLATDGNVIYFPTRAGDGSRRLRRFAIGARMLDPVYAVPLGADVIGLHVDEDIWLAFDDGRLDSRKASSGIIGPASFGRLVRDSDRIDMISDAAVSQGARDNVWAAFDKDSVFWCELEGGQGRGRRTDKKTLNGARALMDRQGCPFGISEDQLLMAAPDAVMLLAK